MDFWTFNKVIAPIISKGVIIIVQDEPHWPHSCWLLSSASLYPAAIEDPAVKIGTNVNQEDNPYLSVIQTQSHLLKMAAQWTCYWKVSTFYKK